MNNTFIPSATLDGNEKGEHPAADYQPAMPTECIKLPESPTAPISSKRWPGWLINEAAEITDEMWASLRPSAITPADWFGQSPGTAPLGIKDRIVEKITNEKRGKIFPLSWDRVQFLADQAYQEWSQREAVAFEDRLRSMDGLRGMGYDDAQKLISSCFDQAGYSGRVSAGLLNLCHRIAQAAHKRGAEGMQKVMEDKLQPGLSTSKRFWFRQQLEQIWCAPIGSPITDDMKRAARVAIQIVDGCKWDGTTWRPINIEKTQPSSQELQSQALGEQAALMGIDVVAAALSADVPLPIPPGSAAWAKIRPVEDWRAKWCSGPDQPDADFRERERAAWFEREADRAAAFLGVSLFDPEPPAPGSGGTAAKPRPEID